MIRAWCPHCDCEVVPRDDGSCTFCDADTDLDEQRRHEASIAIARDATLLATYGMTHTERLVCL